MWVRCAPAAHEDVPGVRGGFVGAGGGAAIHPAIESLEISWMVSCSVSGHGPTQRAGLPPRGRSAMAQHSRRLLVVPPAFGTLYMGEGRFHDREGICGVSRDGRC